MEIALLRGWPSAPSVHPGELPVPLFLAETSLTYYKPHIFLIHLLQNPAIQPFQTTRNHPETPTQPPPTS